MPLELELCPGRWVGGDHPCFIIAEIGQNHQGDMDVAKRMIRMAKECGADCAKFQKSELEHKFNRRALERPYTSKHSWGKTYGEHKRYLEFSHDQYRELQKYAEEIGIFFTASGMDEMTELNLREDQIQLVHTVRTYLRLDLNSDFPDSKPSTIHCTTHQPQEQGFGNLSTLTIILKRANGEGMGGEVILGHATVTQMAVEFLDELNVPFFKVGSGDTNNFPYLEKTAKKGRPMVISSGMQSMDTMRQVYNIVKPINPNFCILQCTSAYPLLPEDVNLRVITEYQKAFPDIPIGYSGHETGIMVSVAAVALGAKVLERHVTLDKTWKGSDHQASLEPGELTELVKAVRLVERALGSPVKHLLPCEVACNEKLGKSVVAKVRIPEGTILTMDMLTVKVGEPKGYPPECIANLIGKKVKVNIEEDDTITEEAIENLSKKIKS
ncbi:N-acetylneuraminate-9-phosphate synthase isoform X1 [Macrotis lagotis]|uniref:N-acetylneuraminate-9-phosphate synthase isoform X1 n=1 Tax=Macrotis lagotis TaxID=92651 RepID=UPI003D69415F